MGQELLSTAEAARFLRVFSPAVGSAAGVNAALLRRTWLSS
jgi:hypothetical protein